MSRTTELQDDIMVVNMYIDMTKNKKEKIAYLKLRKILKRACKEV